MTIKFHIDGAEIEVPRDQERVSVTDDELYWVAAAMLRYDAACVAHPRDGGYQLFLLPRTLCRGQRLTLEPVTPKSRRRKARRGR